MGRKYKALQGIVIKHFIFLSLSPSQKTMESILGNAFSSTLERHNFKFFSPFSSHHVGTLGVTKYVTNGMPKNPWVLLSSRITFLGLLSYLSSFCISKKNTHFLLQNRYYWSNHFYYWDEWDMILQFLFVYNKRIISRDHINFRFVIFKITVTRKILNLQKMFF